MAEQTKESYCDIVLSEFLSNNPHSKVVLEDGSTLHIDSPWGVEDSRIKVSTDEHEFIQDLNKLVFNPKFDAIFHSDLNRMEIAYGYLKPEGEASSTQIGRKFSFHFEARTYECEFARPSERFMRLARHFERLPTDSNERSMWQLIMFRDAQKPENELKPGQKEYFEGKVPCNFCITATNGFEGVNLEKLAHHINFLMCYYDRQSPTIRVKQISEKCDEHPPVRMIETVFPDSCLIAAPIDDIVLGLLNVAARSEPRFAFIYYYQVFEYLGYYYMDGKARSALKNAFRDPSLICGGEEKLDDLFSIFSELNQNDEAKMRKVIEEYCDPRIIWKEVENDGHFFSMGQNFEGGFVAQALIGKDITEETWKAMWMPKTFDLLTKIRNVLVHAREKRESKGILPTKRNDEILHRYIPLIRRIAEQLALKA
ncbi:MAG: hypothetical protein ABII81_02300 [Pseudomonadota bacterium]